MSEEKAPANTGGPAFPLNWERKGDFWATGMTVRDYAAIRAMHAMIVKNGECYAPDAYEMADAMLKARDQ